MNAFFKRLSFVYVLYLYLVGTGIYGLVTAVSIPTELLTVKDVLCDLAKLITGITLLLRKPITECLVLAILGLHTVMLLQNLHHVEMIDLTTGINLTLAVVVLMTVLNLKKTQYFSY